MRRPVLSAVTAALLLAAFGALAQAPILLAEGPAWQELSPREQQALRPLQRDWANADPDSKRQWLGVASRFDRLSPADQARVQQRMDDWARLSPRQRNEARMNYRGAQELSPSERRERWEAYQRLSEDQKRGLASRGAPPAAAPRRQGVDGGKSNTVPNPLLESRRPGAVAPSVSQARPGATTNPLAARPAPPLHQQPGLPKVAATPEFVDQRTLLPQRGAQGAGAEPRRGNKKPARDR